MGSTGSVVLYLLLPLFRGASASNRRETCTTGASCVSHRNNKPGQRQLLQIGHIGNGSVPSDDGGWDDLLVNNEISVDELDSMLRNYKPAPESEEAALLGLEKQGPAKPMVFIHVHKSLGTWMCWAAKQYKVPVPDNGDCSYEEDLPWGRMQTNWPYYNEQNNCNARWTRTKDSMFTEIERWVDFLHEPDGDWCPSIFTYSIILRDPLKRIGSHMSAHTASMSDIEDWFVNPKTFLTPGMFIQSHIPYNDFYVRTLCGRACFWLPPGAITSEHLEKAKHQLDQLDAVLIADNLLTDTVQLEGLTGWQGIQKSAAHHVSNNGCHQTNLKYSFKCQNSKPTQSKLNTLRAWNTKDLELYEYAKQVAARKTSWFTATKPGSTAAYR